MRCHDPAKRSFPTPFQSQVIAILDDTLLSRGLKPVDFSLFPAGLNTYYGGQTVTGIGPISFEIYGEVAYIETDRDRWDSDAFGRNPPCDSDRATNFCHRVGRLLDGNRGWFTPEDQSLPDKVWMYVKKAIRLFRHKGGE
jgi:hypothetical protein